MHHKKGFGGQIVSAKKENQAIVDKIWNFFSSVTLAVVVFTLISVTSMVGTIIEQQAEPARNIKLLSKFVGESFAPTAFRILDALGFTSMYNSWWFLTLLFIFSANIVVCSLDRLPKILKIVREPIKPLSSEILNTMPIKKETLLKKKAEEAEKAVEYALKKIGFKSIIRQENPAGGLQICAEKGKYSRLGVYVTHFSILLILLGAVIGIFFGFNAYLPLLEGTSSAVAYQSDGKKEIPLGFEIRCDDFNTSFYENSDTPKAFVSWLAVIENGKEVLTKEINVNTPLRYKGITFYQSNYGFAPSKDSLFKFDVTSGIGQKQSVNVKFGESFVLHGTNIAAKVIDFSPALGQDPSGKLYTYAEMMNNPAVLLEFSEDGKPKYSQWILTRYPQTWRVPDGIVEFKDLWGAQYTGLQVRKDPGVWAVYLGSLFMSIGLYAAFFMSHARVWVNLSSDKAGAKVAIAASVNKNKIAFEQKIEKFLGGLHG
jgi:cytochrome c biogenesis protein